ncbi:hypothetical protein F511_17508 [Dorcoceras hygrometricum]|uniref:Dystroglycan-like n=1 Tax=Dorcoceras hygrometricum TaxID=472368 RepID=A0A2Z7B0B2_9LAMI|nr:hypothetical protein F511_17508 [Dorcoceras hygrometricum]
MCSGGTVDNQLREAFCVESIPVALQVVSHRFTQLQVMCSGGTVDNQLREAFCVESIPVAAFFTQFPKAMASSLISSSHHIDFDYVFSMEDASLASVFESLITTGLKEFLGCPAIFYEVALTEFFANGSVRDGLVVITIGGTAVKISESVFAAAFELPYEGLTDLSDVPKNLVFDARSLFSDSKEQVRILCFKKELKIEYRLLHDILAKTIYVKAGSFDAVTRDRFMLMTAITFDVKINWSNLLFGVLKAMVTPASRQAKGFAIQIGVVLKNIPGLELGEPCAFPAPRVLNEKTVHRFVHINEQVVMEKTAISPPVKKTPKKKVVSKKRPVESDAEAAPVVKKKRTTKGKPAAIALGSVPLQTFEPTADVPDEQPSKPKRKSQKRKRRLALDDIDETGESATEQPAAGTATDVQETGADVPVATQPAVSPADEEPPAADPDEINEQILTQLDTAATTQGDDQNASPAKESVSWFDLPFELARRDAEGLLSSDTDEDLDQRFSEIETDRRTDGTVRAEQNLELVDKEGPATKASGSMHTNKEHMSIDDLLLQISDDMMLPSVNAAEITKIRLGESIHIPGVQECDLYYASLPIHDKGKEILEEDELVRGNPARETVELICGDVDFLVQLGNHVMKYVVEFFHSFSLNKLTDLDGLKALKAKESLMLNWAETNSLEMAPWTATASQIIDLLSAAHSKSLEVLLIQQKEHGLPIEQPCTLTCLDTSIGSGAVLGQFFSQDKSKCWVRPMVLIDGVWTPIQGNDFLRSSCKLSLFVNRKKLPKSVVEEAFVPHCYLIEPIQYWGAAPSLIKTWGWASVCTEIIRYSMFGCLRPVCQEIVVYKFGVERIQDYLLSDFQRGVCIDTFVGFFSGSIVQTDSEIELSSSDGDTVYRSPSPILQETDSFEENLQFALGPVGSTDAQEEQLYIVESPESPPYIPQLQESSSLSSDSQMHFDSNDFPLDDTTEAQTSLPAATVDLSSLLDDLKSSLSQRMDDAHSEILSRLHTVERALQNTLGNQNEYIRNLIQSARQEEQNHDDLQILRLNELKKSVMAQRVTADTESLALRNRFNALDAKILLLDGQVVKHTKPLNIFFQRVTADTESLALRNRFNALDAKILLLDGQVVKHTKPLNIFFKADVE